MAKNKIKDKKMRETEKKSKKGKNRGLKFLVFLLTLIIIIVSVALIGYNYIYENFLSEIGFFDLNRENIGINKNALRVDGVKTVLLLGTDSGDLTQEGRTDVIILASINTKLKTIKLISIPRDTKVDIKDYWPQKINGAYHYGGAELMLHTINDNFDLNVDDYVLIDYEGVAKVVDAVGGIDLELSEYEIEFINERMAETARNGNIRTGGIYLDAEPGLVHLNGIQAVTHARDRSSTPLSDFDRTERQRNIIQAVIKSVEGQSISQIINIGKKLLGSVETSVETDIILEYLFEVGLNKDQYLNNVKSYQNPSGETYSGYSGRTSSGIYEFIPIMDVTKELFNQYINEE